jgi:hypothetical protein
MDAENEYAGDPYTENDYEYDPETGKYVLIERAPVAAFQPMPSFQPMPAQPAYSNAENDYEYDPETGEYVLIERAPVAAADTSIQIAAPPLPTDDRFLFVELGDYVMIESKKYKGQTKGTVYYRSEELIRIKPDGVSDQLHDFDLEVTDDEEQYKEEDGVTAVYVIRKRLSDAFVEQQDFRVGQTVTAIGENDMTMDFTIIGVDSETDAIEIRMNDGETDRIEFSGVGIPYDLPYFIFSINDFVGEVEDGKEAPKEAEAEAEAEADEAEGKYDAYAEANDANETEPIEVMEPIEITIPVVFREAASYEQRIPDYIQKVDAMNDFIHSLDPALQTDPAALRRIRILVETLFQLNKETIRYGPNGEILGPSTASIRHVADLLAQAPPMARPVLKVDKWLYPTEDAEDEKVEGVRMSQPFEAELKEMVERAAAPMAGGKDAIRFWIDQAATLREYSSTWVASGAPGGQSFPRDTEFFRNYPPYAEEVGDRQYTLEPAVPGYEASHSQKEGPRLDLIPFGMERALGPTYRKAERRGQGRGRGRQLLLPAEAAPLDSYLLFPPSTLSALGKTRSYHLATDSGRSHLRLKTMRHILETIGPAVEEDLTSQSLILLRAVGGALGSIPLTSYVQGITLRPLGWADVFPILVHYGLDGYELYPALYRILLEKMEGAQQQVIAALTRLRQALASQANQPPPSNLLLPDTTLWTSLASQEILVNALEDYQRRNPTLADSDIGKTLYLIRHHDNFFQVTAGRDPVRITKAVQDAYQLQYSESLRLQSRIRQLEKEREAIQRPKKNKCPHVADMVSVRRLRDETERFHELAKVFRRYQGERKENWFHCNLCKEAFLCIHERLQLQAYLHPREKDVLVKEIILTCSGGQFQGRYICRNCGQGFQDMEFDRGMEFDDEGRPKGGRVLEDAEDLAEERIETLLRAESELDVEDTERWEMTAEEKQIMLVVRRLSERVGVSLTQEDMKRVVAQMVHALSTYVPSEAQYNAAKLNKQMPYKTYLARTTITYAATFLLLAIQTKTPPYVIRYRLTGCKVSTFDGFPLDDETNTNGMEYLACAIASLKERSPPWSETEYYKWADEERVKKVKDAILGSMRKVLSKDPAHYAALEARRKYMAEVMGQLSAADDQIPRDMVFPTFLPALTAPSPAEAAEDPIAPEIAEKMGAKGEIALVRLWIRRAHAFAEETTQRIAGSPFLETTCCMSALAVPQEAWSTLEDMPPLARRILTPNEHASALVTSFHPRPEAVAVVEPNKELFYRVFLSYCFQGPRIGRPHELNMTHHCMWCGFQFPTHPKVMDAESEGRPALASQNVQTDQAAFVPLLDRVHLAHEVRAPPRPAEIQFPTIMAEFGAVEPPPSPEWSDLMEMTMDQFARIPANMNAEEKRGEVLQALGILSQMAQEAEQEVVGHLGALATRPLLDAMRGLVQQSWASYWQILQTYWITALQRMLSGFSVESLFLPKEMIADFSDQHIDDLKTKIIKPHYALSPKLHMYNMTVPALDLARAKMELLRDQWAALLPYRDKIRTLTLPGHETTLQYFQRYLFYVPLAAFLDGSQAPDGFVSRIAIQEVGNKSMELLRLFTVDAMVRYKKESLAFDDQTIRDMLVDQVEKERSHVVKQLMEAGEEERAIDKINRRLGLGKYAVGGTKLIYMYDKDFYDQERVRRLDSGMIDFPGVSTGEDLPAAGREYDVYGLPVFQENAIDEWGQGYDMDQHGEEE